MLFSFCIQALTIEVVKDSSTDIDTAGLKVTVCDIDKYSYVKSSVLRQIQSSKDSSEVEQVIQQNATKLHQSILCLAKVTQYGIKKHPAIIINGKYLTYGETDVARALLECQRRGYCNED